MAYVVTQACIGCRYGECIEVCPQEAFHEGPNFVVIDPDACANCALCEMVCPVQAIHQAHGLEAAMQPFVALNAELARRWPKASYRGPLPQADALAARADKLALLDRGGEGPP
ncbi:ferredoxin family protein [Variovorax sp. KK3]|uniref:ferredoxin family protein n=1 Tax=Variovorax sp. KK3 TaxID=1855728 RepID=UPI00097BBCCD|nr:ferredoxin family protein [Variovorax sp. KK3]